MLRAMITVQTVTRDSPYQNRNIQHAINVKINNNFAYRSNNYGHRHTFPFAIGQLTM